MQSRFLLLVCLMLLLAACAGPLREPSKIDEAFTPERWETIAVLPFSGSPATRRPASEFFAQQIQKQTPFRVLTPGFSEIMLKRQNQLVSSSNIEIAEAQKFGRSLQAQGVFVGSITEEYGKWSFHTRAKVMLIDVAKGQVVAQVDQISNDFAPIGYEKARDATKRAAAAMVPFVVSLGTRAGK